MTSKSIASLTHDECCGCKACGDICPKNAISFLGDDEGFLYPAVNENCIDCGLCSKVCPSKSSFMGCEDSDQLFIGCLDKNVERRNTGSSGGVFGLLASSLMSEGYVICASAFDDNLKLRHCFANNDKEVERQKKSKYLQSDCSGVYRQIKEKLMAGQHVMFVGTPCQCMALKAYLGKISSEALIVDFACHGVPSQDLFDKCIQHYEQKHNCKVKSYSFRHKPKRYGAPKNFLLYIQKGNKTMPVEGKYYEEPFYCGFQKYITLRPSCYQCKFARTERVSDITLADFWGVEDVTNKWDRTDHPSLVIVNSDKGKQFFDRIKPQLDLFETTKEKGIKKNGSLFGSTTRTKERDDFFTDLKKLPFEEVVEKHLKEKRVLLKDLYYATPFSIRKIMLNILNK